MSIVVDHEQRRREILARALELFGESGYEGVTFQKLADRCGLARTTLYKYFTTKREIFDYTVRHVTRTLAERYLAEMKRTERTAVQRLESVMLAAVDALYDNRVLLWVLLEYLVHRKRGGEDVSRRVRFHTVGLKLALHQLVKEALRNGDFVGLQLGDAKRLLYSVLESAILQLTLTGAPSRDHFYRLIRQLLADFAHTASGARPAAPPVSQAGQAEDE